MRIIPTFLTNSTLNLTIQCKYRMKTIWERKFYTYEELNNNTKALRLPVSEILYALVERKA